MTRIVDLALLRQVTTDAMRVYEAVQQAEALTEEGKRVVAAAESMLRETALAFLPEEGVVITDNQREHPIAREKMIANYVTIQRGYADLKDALYRLARVQMSARKWGEALITLHALSKVDPDYRDVKSLQHSSRVDYLRDLLPANADATDDRIQDLGICVERSLQELVREEPQVRNVVEYNLALSHAQSCAGDNPYALPYLRGALARLKIDLSAVVAQGHSQEQES